MAKPGGRGRPPTSVDIARAAGTSQATVSRALNGGRVAAATRDRILAISRELGYTPNAAARSMVTSRTGLVGVVVSDLTNPFYPEFLEEIAAAVAARGQHMLLQNAGSVELLLQQRVDGIVFTAAVEGSAEVADLAARRFPVVLANRVVDAGCDSVEGDHPAGAAAVVDHLAELGHRRIAVLAGLPGASTSARRLDGIGRRLAERGLPPPDVRETGFDYDRAVDAATDLLTAAAPPTAIVGLNDQVAFAVLNAAAALGVAVPGELSVAGFDDVRQAAWPTLGLTTVRQPLAAMAARSVALLNERIDEPGLPPRHEVLPADLIVRRTTGPVRT
ncbi:LacI family DNA-binding transcriptional regulator [Jiangella alkaliphila]|uniref:Transcriptional regulator, LacI family n=1 Tax=Jiangella alkaliphila TaxID=419479 RepID=A0A1H2M3I5_9ACTN|nr:LacI family DNA-binding transcriptional regulator [Jiangella alkaliphila]SDU87682.1 transcriptional regulator, LacI family [Jiangella alkaliphila]